MNNQIFNFASKIISYPRSITGFGVRQTLKEIKKILELKIHKVKSGTRVFDWQVPLEWKVNDAYIITPDKKKFVITKKTIFIY